MWALAAPTESTPAADTESEPEEELLPAQPSPTRPPPATMTRSAQAIPKPEKPPAASPPPIADDDLFAGPMPDFMVDLHARVLDKRRLGAHQQKQLYDYGKANKTDARPQLILAWDAVNREWEGIAVQMYRIAHQADPRAARDSRMLPDLLMIASHNEPNRVEFRDVLELTRKAYNKDEVLVRIEEELDELNASGELQRADRLSRLRDELRK
jgi:hypothetical protein